VGTAKRGIAIKQEMQTEIYRMSRLADISENKVIVRMLRIAREDLAAFDDAGLRQSCVSRGRRFENCRRSHAECRNEVTVA